MVQLLKPETDIMVQFLVPEIVIMGERNYILVNGLGLAEYDEIPYTH